MILQYRYRHCFPVSQCECLEPSLRSQDNSKQLAWGDNPCHARFGQQYDRTSSDNSNSLTIQQKFLPRCCANPNLFMHMLQLIWLVLNCRKQSGLICCVANGVALIVASYCSYGRQSKEWIGHWPARPVSIGASTIVRNIALFVRVIGYI